jgi:hypothetical protein
MQIHGMTAYTDAELISFVGNSQTASPLELELAKRLGKAAVTISGLQIECDVLSSLCREYEASPTVQVIYSC